MMQRTFFSAEDPVSLAGWLLEEISRGMVPVWPSTRPYAERIVQGLLLLHSTRREEVMAAIGTVPTVGLMDWPSLLGPVVERDARRA